MLTEDIEHGRRRADKLPPRAVSIVHYAQLSGLYRPQRPTPAGSPTEPWLCLAGFAGITVLASMYHVLRTEQGLRTPHKALNISAPSVDLYLTSVYKVVCLPMARPAPQAL